MTNNSHGQELSRQERKQLKRLEKQEGREKFRRTRLTKNFLISALVLALVVGGGWLTLNFLKNLPTPAGAEIISRSGIHWHPQLSIYLKEQKQEIPANIGLGFRHETIHTHEPDGVLHIETEGLITTKSDILLGRFFKIWGKEFNANCIFDYCNGPEGTVKMFVNGKENNEFGNYLMRDGDKIEIRFD